MNPTYVKLLAQSSFMTVNKDIARAIGLHESILLAELCAQKGYQNKEWFRATIETIERETTLTRAQQDISIKKLTQLKIIEKRVIGLPPIREFKINQNQLEKFIKAKSRYEWKRQSGKDPHFATERNYTKEELDELISNIDEIVF